MNWIFRGQRKLICRMGCLMSRRRAGTQLHCRRLPHSTIRPENELTDRAQRRDGVLGAQSEFSSQVTNGCLPWASPSAESQYSATNSVGAA